MSRRRLVGAAFALAAVGIATPPAGTAHAATSTAPGTYALYCSGSSPTAFTGCYADGATTPVSVPAGSTVTTDPTVPPTGLSTSGLTAPDGILAVIPPAKAPSTVPAGATTVLYIDKQVGYFIPGALTSKLTLPVSNTTIGYTGGSYAGFGAGTYYFGGNTTNTIEAVTCTGATTAALTGCTSTSSTADSVSAGNSIGAPGSCVASSVALATIGEGSTKPKTLFKNNEDFAAVHEAYTTDGRTFTDITPAGGIPGLGNPTEQNGLRWISPGGTVITNPDGTLGMFYSGGVCTDGDSDAFGSVYYSTSTDGLTWSAPSQISSTGSPYNSKLAADYSYSASIANQPANNSGNAPLDVSAYYEGRIYSPSVVQNADGSLTMTFAGYRTSKPLPATGSGALAIGRAPGSTDKAATQYTPTATEPALYRNILSVPLTAVAGSSPTSYTAGTPKVAQVRGGPWTLAQGDPSQAPYAPNGGVGNGTYTPGGSPSNVVGATTYPNLSTYPGSGSTGNAVPYTTGYSGTPGPLTGLCGTGGAGNSAAPIDQPAASTLPMSPYYFPHIERNASGGLTGYFDYRPKDANEAAVVANSTDGGLTWTVAAKALELSANHCPNGNPDKVAQTTNDDGQGHPFDLTVGGAKYLYTVVRAAGVLDTVGSQFVAHAITPGAANLGLPASEPTGTNSPATTTVGAQTVTNAVGGVSTSTFNVASTGTTEIPGRIYVTVAGAGAPVALPEAPLTVAVPAAGVAALGLGWVLLRRRSHRRHATTA